MPEISVSDPEKAMNECLHVIDSRTGKPYAIPIHDGDCNRAADVAQITVSDTSNVNGNTGAGSLRPLRILDNGFQHTACTVSSITFMYVVAGHRSSF